MKNRVIEIGARPTRLRIERRQLVIEQRVGGSNGRRGDGADGVATSSRVPIDDLAVLCLAHPQISLTQPVLAELADRGTAVVVCDRQRMPAGLLMPLDAHSVQAERIRAQLDLSAPRRKRLWQAVVRAKILMQAELLRARGCDDRPLRTLIRQVRSGDVGNVESQAARIYWTTLFGSDFRRDRDAAGQNAALNSGYAVVRAAVARAICGSGLHPSIGLHHSNKYNAFCLADDLIEPFRPCVDRVVAEAFPRSEPQPDPTPFDPGGEGLDQAARRTLLTVLTDSVAIGGETRGLLDAIGRVTASLAQAIADPAASLTLPESLGIGSAETAPPIDRTLQAARRSTGEGRSPPRKQTGS